MGKVPVGRKDLEYLMGSRNINCDVCPFDMIERGYPENEYEHLGVVYDEPNHFVTISRKSRTEDRWCMVVFETEDESVFSPVRRFINFHFDNEEEYLKQRYFLTQERDLN